MRLNVVCMKAGQIRADEAPSAQPGAALPHLSHLSPPRWLSRWQGCRVLAVSGWLSLSLQRLLQTPTYGGGTENWMVGETLICFKTSSFWKGQGKKVKNPSLLLWYLEFLLSIIARNQRCKAV